MRPRHARYRIGKTILVVLSVAPLLLVAEEWNGSGRGTRPAGQNFATRSPVYADHGVAATTNPLSSAVAIEVLRSGGTAMDAAIAANAVLGVVEPMMTGLGGDLFAMVWDPKTRQVLGFNGSGRSAAGLTITELKKRLGAASYMPRRGPLSVTVPGAVDGWFELHRRFGRLPMRQVLRPAIEYAREGFPVSQHTAYAWRAIDDPLRTGRGIGIDGLKATFTIDGRPPREGERMRNPRMARSLELISRRGRDAFYSGEIAKLIDAFMREAGGSLRASDLAGHAGTWVQPVSTTYRGFEVLALPPNGQGIAVLQTLNILEGYDIRRMGLGSAGYAHVLIEALKLAYEDRARFYADPALTDIPMARLLSKDYADHRRASIDLDRARRPAADTLPDDQGETTYLTVADRDGMMVSLISSLYGAFGSGEVPGDLGFALQNRGAGFNLEAGHPNTYAPSKRPFHTIIPGFVLKDKEPYLSFGVLGGAMQPQGQVQIIVNMIDFGLNVQEAGDAARLRIEGGPQPERPSGEAILVQLENGFSAAVVAALEQKGHKVDRTQSLSLGLFGGYQGIVRDPITGVFAAGSEMRMDGAAAGY